MTKAEPKESFNKLSEFQKKVYKAVLKIPVGQVRSYSWVAKKIDRPKAVRAVGTALKNNPFAPIVPCHRVIKSDGDLGGFSSGSKRKKELIELEKNILDSVF
jgi:O-6-methylguanine DNA methyltransferase